MAQQTRNPQKKLGLLDATMVGIGAMIGAGIFVLTGLAAQIAGPAAIFVFVLNGIVTTFTAFSYAELASSIPKSGGGYAFVREVFSSYLSFLMGWMLWSAYMIAGALYALGFAANLVEWLGIYNVALPFPTAVYAVLVVLLFVALNILSTSATGETETVVTLIKIGVLVVFAVFGVAAVQLGNFQPLLPGDTGVVSVLSAMGLTFIAFEGYDLITTVTEEVENPRKNIPRAIFLSLAVAIIIYIVVVFVAIGAVGARQLGAAGETAIAQAAAEFMPTFPVIGGGESLIAFGAVFATMSALNAVVLASSRVVFTMGRDHQFFPRAGRRHSRFGTPFWAVLFSATGMVVTVVFIPIQKVGNFASLLFLLSFVLVNASVIQLRKRRPDMRRPFSIPFYPAPPIMAIGLNLLLGFFIDAVIWGITLGWVLAGTGVYFILKSKLVSVEME